MSLCATIEINGQELEAEAETEGSYYPATRMEPAEYPDLVNIKVFDEEGEEVDWEEWSDKDKQRLEDKLWDNWQDQVDEVKALNKRYRI